MPSISSPYQRAYDMAVIGRRAAVPFGSDPSNTTPELTTVGFDGEPDEPGVGFHSGWSLTAPANSPLTALTAMFTGSLRRDASSGEVTLHPTDPVLSSALKYRGTSWFELPTRLVYGGIDPADLERTLDMHRPQISPDYPPWPELLRDFLAGTSTMPIRAGSPLVDHSEAVRSYTITAYDDEAMPGIPLSLELSWYLGIWPEFFGNLAGHSLSEQLREMRWSFWTSPHTIHYVRKRGGVTADVYPPGGPQPFTDSTRPARNLADAIQHAASGDTILILDSEVYAEGELVIDKALSIISTAVSRSTRRVSGSTPTDSSGLRDPTATGFQPDNFPRIRPRGGNGRVLRADGSNGTVPFVTLMGLTIENGRTRYVPHPPGSSDGGTSPVDPCYGAGAGIAIQDVTTASSRRTPVVIFYCCIQNNQTSVPAVNQADLRSLKAALRAKIQQLVADIPLIPDATRSDLQLRAQGQVDRIPDSQPNQRLTGQSFGAGVATLWSDALIMRCLIQNNRAAGRGGGVAVVGYGWPVINGCTITHNRAEVARRDGGGIGIEVAVPERLGRDLTEQDMADYMTAFIPTITWPDVLSTIRDGLARVARAAAGDARSIDDLKAALLYGIARHWLEQQRWSCWEQLQVQRARVGFVRVTACEISHNVSVDDGGGIYASVLGRVEVSDSNLHDNECDSGGGGAIRATMGSDLTVLGCSILNNTARAGLNAQGEPTLPGGGGIACRNVALNIRSGFGPGTGLRPPTTVQDNDCINYAGGGLCIEATSEGAMLNFPNFWHAILQVVFNLDPSDTLQVGVNIAAGTAITGNHAGSNAGPSPHGKGGGLYIIRGREPDVADLHVTIADIARTVTGNTAHAGRHPDGYGAFHTSNVLELIDLENTTSIGDDQIGAHLGGSGGDDFVYEGT